MHEHAGFLQAPSGSLCLQLGRYGGIADELENLKRDRVLLVEELRRQRQRQQVQYILCVGNT